MTDQVADSRLRPQPTAQGPPVAEPPTIPGPPAGKVFLGVLATLAGYECPVCVDWQPATGITRWGFGDGQALRRDSRPGGRRPTLRDFWPELARVFSEGLTNKKH